MIMLPWVGIVFRQIGEKYGSWSRTHQIFYPSILFCRWFLFQILPLLVGSVGDGLVGGSRAVCDIVPLTVSIHEMLINRVGIDVNLLLIDRGNAQVTLAHNASSRKKYR